MEGAMVDKKISTPVTSIVQMFDSLFQMSHLFWMKKHNYDIWKNKGLLKVYWLDQ